MKDEITIFYVMRIILLCLSPLVFLEGIFLLLFKKDRYSKLEEQLNKDIGGIRKRLIPKLETNTYTFHKWLLKRSFILGLIFIVYSIMLFIVLTK